MSIELHPWDATGCSLSEEFRGRGWRSTLQTGRRCGRSVSAPSSGPMSWLPQVRCSMRKTFSSWLMLSLAGWERAWERGAWKPESVCWQYKVWVMRYLWYVGNFPHDVINLHLWICLIGKLIPLTNLGGGHKKWKMKAKWDRVRETEDKVGGHKSQKSWTFLMDSPSA